MRTEVIRADTIDAAVDSILVELGTDTISSRENVIYFDGWDGLGASAVLQAVAERLAISNELAFDKVINIDCSKWQSTRAVQRKIAEQLELPSWVMEVFDKQNEEDDFDGLDECSRGVVAQVVTETYQTIKNSRFIVILQNGSDEEMDMLSFGLSLYTPYANSKVLWTFQGRFRLDPKMTDKVTKSTTTHVFLSAASSESDNERAPQERLWSYLVCREAAQISNNNSKHGDGDGIIDPAIVAQCSLYMLKQCSIGSHIIDYDWGIHTSNYWICDGIIAPAVEQEEIDKSWKVGDALQREMQLNADRAKGSTALHPYLERSNERTPYWFSTVTSRFVVIPSGVIPSNMFQHSDRLGVLKLSGCTFSFSSPPFLCCHSLKFLWLDHCQDLPLSTTNKDSSDNHHSTDAADKEVEESWEFFQSLWVLDLRCTDWDRILSAQVMDLMTQLRELNVMGAKSWDMSHIRGRLRNIRKLRITKSTCSFDDDNLFSEMETMELLDFSGNHITPGGMTSISGPAKGSRLETVIINGCDGLKTFSLGGWRGELKKLLLKGLLGSLEVLDLSGIRVKTLDLREMDTPVLKQLILLGCEKLVAIKLQWMRKNMYMIRIDTTSTSASASAQHTHPVHGDRSLQQQKEKNFTHVQISLADARRLRSIDSIIYPLYYLHIDICPPAGVQGTSRDKLVQVTSSSSMEDCPEIPVTSLHSGIIKVIKQGQGNKLLEDAQGGASTSSALLLTRAAYNTATSLHMYDDLSTTGFSPPEGLQWHNLRWCRVERCPKLDIVFAAHLDHSCPLKTFWASQLLTARYIWENALRVDSSLLTFLHLDYCPRLIHVLPLSMAVATFRYLETLEIVCCSDLREVFPCVPAARHQEQDTLVVAANNKVNFPCLKHIHLHELPMLHHVCPRSISAPNLETIKIRGCWSLTRLPAIGGDTRPPMVDCEKEWWDKLEWDGVEAYHHPSLYQPTYSGNSSLV